MDGSQSKKAVCVFAVHCALRCSLARGPDHQQKPISAIHPSLPLVEEGLEPARVHWTHNHLQVSNLKLHHLPIPTSSDASEKVHALLASSATVFSATVQCKRAESVATSEMIRPKHKPKLLSPLAPLVLLLCLNLAQSIVQCSSAYCRKKLDETSL